MPTGWGRRCAGATSDGRRSEPLAPTASADRLVHRYLSVEISPNAELVASVEGDSSASGGPFNNIGLTAGTATQITNAAADRSSITRFLGLFVSNVNGATSFRGNDGATLTFTLTVP